MQRYPLISWSSSGFKFLLWFKAILPLVYENYLLILQNGLDNLEDVCKRLLWSAAKIVEALNNALPQRNCGAAFQRVFL